MKQEYDRGEFESIISELVKPLNNQYPRPWMTKLEILGWRTCSLSERTRERATGRMLCHTSATSLLCSIDRLKDAEDCMTN